MATFYCILVNGRERKYPTPEARFTAYVGLERRYVAGMIRELEAYDVIEQYGRRDYLPVTIYTEGEPDRG